MKQKKVLDLHIENYKTSSKMNLKEDLNKWHRLEDLILTYDGKISQSDV